MRVCCRKGWWDTAAGCDGSIGGQNFHTCVLATTTAAPKEEFTATAIMPNCTTFELSPRQWGASYYSYTKPVYAPGSDTQFIPKSYSIYNWGN